MRFAQAPHHIPHNDSGSTFLPANPAPAAPFKRQTGPSGIQLTGFVVARRVRRSGRVGRIAAGRLRLAGGLQFRFGSGLGIGLRLQALSFRLLGGLLASLQFLELKLCACGRV